MRAAKGALVLVLAFLAACASLPDKTRVGVTTAIGVLSIVGDQFDRLDQQKVDAIKEKAAAGDVAGATADLAKWKSQSERLMQAFQLTWDSARLTASVLQLYEAGSAKPADVSTALGKLLAALADLSHLAQDAGIRLPLPGADGGV